MSPLQKTPKIIKPKDVSPSMEENEVAQLLLDYFRKDIIFVKTGNGKTADFLIGNQYWELKSPCGKGKNVIEHQIQRAKKQSCNIIISLRRTNLLEGRAIAEIRRQVKLTPQIKRMLVVLKSGRIRVIK